MRTCASILASASARERLVNFAQTFIPAGLQPPPAEARSGGTGPTAGLTMIRHDLCHEFRFFGI